MAFSSRLKPTGKPEAEDFDSLTRRQEAMADARRKAAEDEVRREAYEAEKARQATIARSKEEAARRAMRSSGGDSFGYASSPQPQAPGSQAFTWKKADQAAGKGLSFGGSLKSTPPPAAAPAPAADSRRPGHDACEQAISAMISRTYNGMKEGLQMLGLPDYPLSFAPGRELKLCGHHVREEINEMIHHWMTDEKEDFYTALAKIKGVVSKPILTEEELDLLDGKEEWQRVIGPDGQPRYTRRQDGPAPGFVAEDDDDDDEVIDIAPDGTRLSARPTPAAAPAQAPHAPTREEDYYSLLGVSTTASLQEIRSKFRALVMTAHPEKGGDPKTFQRLNKAYGVLSDQKKRQEYDESLR